MNRLEFYNFTLLAYPFIPGQDAYDSYWVNMPNSYCDGRVAHQRLEDMLEVFAASERMGYDGIVVNEHHATPAQLHRRPILPRPYSSHARSGSRSRSWETCCLRT